MHHIKPTLKGDPLCPLGFHPQVRWPTRCKRCFRDYKEHGNRNRDNDLRKDDFTVSSPSLSSWTSASTIRESEKKNEGRSWTSSTNLSSVSSSNDSQNSSRLKSSSSWTSTPDLQNVNQNDNNSVTFNLTLPRRRPPPEDSSNEDDDYRSTKYVVRRRTSHLPATSTSSSNADPNDQSMACSDSNISFSVDDDYRSTKYVVRRRTSHLPATSTSSSNAEPSTSSNTTRTRSSASPRLKTPDKPSKADVDFILQVKDAKKTRRKENLETDTESLAGTETTDTTETTLVNDNEYSDQIDLLRHELDNMKAKCEKLEREKSDILLRRLASMETTTSKTTASELLKLQQRVNELKTENEDLNDEKKSLSLRVRELETEAAAFKKSNAAEREAEALRTKLAAAEGLCEELMDENEEMKKELRYLEEEMDEMQDHFREDQADEYSSLKKELEQTAKNCRILSFKLRKSERRSEQLEAEKLEAEKKCREVCGGMEGVNKVERIQALEKELKLANETAEKLQKDLKEATDKLERANGGKPPKLGALPKTPSVETAEKLQKDLKEATDKLERANGGKPPKLGALPKTPSVEKVSRETLTRGGSQEDPTVLMRDLQDSMEREADLREQLRFAEEEGQSKRSDSSCQTYSTRLTSLATQVISIATQTDHTSHSETQTCEDMFTIKENDRQINLKEFDHLERLVKNIKIQSEESCLDTKVETEHYTIDTCRYDVQLLDISDDENTHSSKDLEAESAIENDTANCLNSECLLSDYNITDEIELVLSINLDEEKGTQYRLDSKEFVSEHTADVTTANDSNIAILANEEVRFDELCETIEGNTPRPSDSSLITYDEALDVDYESIRTLKTHFEGHPYFIKPICFNNGTANEELLGSTSILRGNVLDRLIFSLIHRVHYKSSALPETLFSSPGCISPELGAVLAGKGHEIEKVRAESSTEKTQITGELESLKSKLSALEAEKKKFETDILEKSSKITQLEASIREERERATDLSVKAGSAASRELNQLREELTQLKKEAQRNAEKVTKLERDKTSLEENLKSKETQMTKTISDLQTKCSTLEKSLTAEQKQKALKEKELKTKESEINVLKNQSSDNVTKQITELKTQYEQEIKKLEDTLVQERQEYEDLTNRYDILEGEHVDIKASLVKEKENNHGRLQQTQKELREATAELKTLRETYNKPSVAKEEHSKSYQLQTTLQRLTEVAAELKRASQLPPTPPTTEESQNRIRRAAFAAKKSVSTESDHTGESSSRALHRKGSLYRKSLSLEQTSQLAQEENIWKMTDDNDSSLTSFQSIDDAYENVKYTNYGRRETSMDRLEAEEKARKSDVAAVKMRYDKRATALSDELKAIQGQVLRFKRERDTFKHMLEGAQKTIADLKASHNSPTTSRLSGGSTHSEVITTSDRKKKGLFGKLKQLTRSSHSVDRDSDTSQFDPGSDTSLDDSRNLKDRITGIFKKSGSTSRANSVEKKLPPSGNLSDSGGSRTLLVPRASPSRSESGGMKKVPPGSAPIMRKVDDLKAVITSLEQQISCMEDELSESRLETSRLKTELVSEKSAAEIKLSELTSKVNELEEDRLLSSGRTNKIPGLKTRMELAWHKEREEQQRLLQETSTLARDLRQTLFEVERERDKERLEAKRRFDQMKKTTEEEQEECRRKLTEVTDQLGTRRSSPQSRLTPEPAVDKDEGISVDENVGELKLLLELNEQETAVLRRKVEETEGENLKLKKTVKELRDKIAAKTSTKKLLSAAKDTGRASPTQDLKIKNLEEEISQVKQKIVEKDKECERLTSELKLAQKKPKSLQKSISLDGDQQTVDLKRQLQLVEQEATILRTKTQTLESENETLMNENRKLQMMRNTKRGKSVEGDSSSVIELKEKIKTLENEINESNNKIKEYEEKVSSLTNNSSKIDTLNSQITQLEETNKKLSESLNRLKQDAIPNILEHFKSRTVKKPSDNLTKVQLKRLVEELDAELSEAIVTMNKLVGKKDDNTKSKKDSDDKYKKEIDELKKKLSTSQKELSEFQKINFSEQDKLTSDVKKLEQEKKTISETLDKLENDKKSLEDTKTKLEEEKTKLKSQVNKLTSDLKKVEKAKSDMNLKILEVAVDDLKAVITSLEQQISCMEDELSESRLETSRLKTELVSEKSAAEIKLSELTSKVNELDANSKRLEELEKQLSEAEEKRKKAERLVTAVKEKNSNLQKDEYLKSYEEKLLGSKETETWMMEVKKFENIIDEKSSELETLRKESHELLELNELMRKETEELRKKLEDYEKVSKAQNTMKVDTSAIERELRETKTRLEAEEKARKSDVAAVKMRYDKRATALSDELKAIQGQVLRFKRERDTFKHMLEGAQKTIADLKASHNSPTTRSSISSTSEEVDDLKAVITSLEQQISCMEDELSESRLETSRLKTELVSEKSAAEIKLSELTSKVNELEEDRLLSSGRTNKIPGLKTRMELAWHKEREEQQRLLQETSTLARDLRQTLFEVERERDKERLEAKRRFDQMKKTTEEEQEECRRKLTEMQCDLLELRDAHAKLRTTNEKLRREKEKVYTSSRPVSEDSERKVQSLVKIVEELRVLSPELFPGPGKTPPTPPARRKGPKSRESSPNLERRETSNVNSREPSVAKEEHSKSYQLQTTLQRLTEVAAELKRASQLPPTPPTTEESQNRIRRAAFAAKKSVSTESDHTGESSSRALHRKGSLYRKSLSLEQTSQLAQEEEYLKSYEEKLLGSKETETWMMEVKKFENIIDEKSSELETLRKESHELLELNELMRKETEELRKKLEDYEKVSKAQNTMKVDTSAIERELRETKTRLEGEEKARKSDVAAVKMRYDKRATALSDELKAGYVL
ncbi:LOW QUALITY PROTEIN: COP1-interactive protein 1-like [Diaphorina citri]|uniref:LOW QUALITY PROTEIN: COP1-interactive protein 1-like n=1 Tax=Diaphorina citri TaxID=121845 RepID=A0A3Q0IKG4_DIACI|nr:LOW QUALITY PROTEIN: COP1-interactive protein 1-like [Diaphorina citri]